MMKRRSFLKGLLAVPAVAAVPVLVQASEPDVFDKIVALDRQIICIDVGDGDQAVVAEVRFGKIDNVRFIESDPDIKAIWSQDLLNKFYDDTVLAPLPGLSV